MFLRVPVVTTSESRPSGGKLDFLPKKSEEIDGEGEMHGLACRVIKGLLQGATVACAKKRKAVELVTETPSKKKWPSITV